MSNDKRTYIDPDDLDGAAVEAPAEPPDAEAPFRFRLGDEIARGGLGRVSSGFDHALDREVAIKSLLREHPGAQARFDREMLLTARLQHPNIVPVYDGGTDPEGRRYLAMRLVHGRSLEQAIDEAGAALEDRLALLPHVVAACNAVAYAHNERITHRDIKPDNILVGAFGETVVIDWGLAKDLDALDEPTYSDIPERSEGPDSGRSSRASGASLTRVGSVMGTPAYMPPEQASGRAVDQRADVYALGAVLYHLLTAHRPFHDADDVLAAVVAGPPVPVEQRVAKVPRDLLAVVRKAMARAPADRYADAGELALELEAFEAGAWVSVYDYSPTERLLRWVQAHPLATTLAVILAITIGVAIVGLTRAYNIANEQRREVVSLERAQRDRADQLTLDHARTFAQSDPTRSLQLLDTLSERMPFDGAVHTVASAAVSHQPARRIFDAGPGTSIVAAGNATALLVGSDRTVRQFDADLATVSDFTLPDRVTGLAASGELAAACTERALHPFGGTPVPLEFPCHGLFAADAGVVVRGPEGRLALWDGQAVVELGALEGRRRMFRGAVWVVRQDSLVEHAVQSGLPVQRRIRAPMSSNYARAEAPDGTLAFIGTPPVTFVEPGSTAVHQPSIDAGWLSSGAWLGAEWLLAGGDTEQLWVVPRAPSATPYPMAIRGRPVGMVQSEDRVAIATDAGRLYVATLDGDEVLLRELGAPDELLSNLLVAPGNRVAWVGQHTASVQSLEPSDGLFVHRFERTGLLIPTSRGMVARSWGGGAVLLRDGAVVETLMEGATYGVTECGGRLWMASETMLQSDGIDPVRMPIDAPGGLYCAGDGTWGFGAAGEEGFLFDATTGAILGTVPLPGLSIRAGYRAKPYRDGLMVFSRQLWEIPGPNRAPVRHMPDLTEGFTGDVVDGTLVVGTRDGRVVGESGAVLATTNGTVTAVAGVGEQLVTGGNFGEVSRWASLDAEIEDVPGHRQYVHHLVPHPSGRWVASTGWDDTVWIWDLSTTPASGRSLEAHRAAVLDAEWSADGTRLYTADRAGVIRVWMHDLPTDPTALRAFVHERAAALER